MSKSEVEKLNKYLASRENELTIKLAGRKIKSVRFLSKEEAHGLGWEITVRYCIRCKTTKETTADRLVSKVTESVRLSQCDQFGIKERLGGL